jgi:hypothetical protein
VGYNSEQAGLMGAALLLAGILAAVTTAPLFDRVLSFHLGLVIKCLGPLLAAAWLSLIWAGMPNSLYGCISCLTHIIVRPNNTVGLYVILVIIGVTSITMLPIALELGCEVTRNAEGSSAILWFSYVKSTLSCLCLMAETFPLTAGISGVLFSC